MAVSLLLVHLNPRGLIDIMKGMGSFWPEPLRGGDHVAWMRKRKIDAPPDKCGIGHDKILEMLKQQKRANIRRFF